MCPVQLRDWGSGVGQDRFDALRCILCGEIVDPVIVRNRIRARGTGAYPRNGRARHRVPVIAH